MIRSSFVAVVICIALVSRAAAQDDKVYRALPSETTEKMLQDLKIEFKKSSSKKGDEHYYEFTRDGFKIRLTQFSPTELKLDCVFRGIPLESVNVWNFEKTRVTRALYYKDTSGAITLLEYGFDISGGVTAGAVKQFVTRFDQELKRYDQFVNGSINENVILTEVKNDKIENLLKSIGVNYKKKENKEGVMMFAFELNGHDLWLYNFGGKDLMIDTHFKKMSLEDANRYNLNRKFIRVVNYKGKDEYTALECNLDCEAGVSEGMIRHWILSFGEDAQLFAEYAKKVQTAGQK